MRKEDDISILHEYDILPNSREIFLVTEEEVDSLLCSSFIKNLRFLELKSKQPIIIHQYSVGGDWTAGMAIYDAILQSPCKFVFVCYGFAASMGSLIPQAVKDKGYRITMPNCDWLIHEGTISLESNYKSAASQLEAQKQLLSKMYNIYSSVCEGSIHAGKDKKSKVTNLIKRRLSSKEDWWLSGQEAVDYGFADAVLGSSEYETIDKILGYL